MNTLYQRKDIMDKKNIKLRGKVKAAGQMDGGDYIKITIHTGKRHVFSTERDLYIPASEQDMRLAGGLIGRDVEITICEKKFKEVKEKKQKSEPEVVEDLIQMEDGHGTF
jgi:hypothetical protein